MKLTRLCLLLSCFLATASAAEPPQRVIIPTAPARLEDSEGEMRNPTVRTRLCLSLYLQEWLARAKGVLVVDEAQAGAVLDRALSPALIREEGSVFLSVAGVIPVNTVITYEEADGNFILVLHRKSGEKRLTIPYTKTGSLLQLITGVTDFLAEELGIDRASSPLARDLPKDNPQLVEDNYTSRRLWAGWMSNSGEARLALLRPYLKRLPEDPFTSAAVLNAAAWMTLDGRGVKKADHGIAMAEQALLCLLGTEREAEALLFCRHNKYDRGLIETSLLTIIERSGLDDFDTALAEETPADDLDTTLADTAREKTGMVALLSGEKTLPQQAGAIHCLGAMKSAKALPHLERIAKAEQASLRQAAAFALGEYEKEDGLKSLRALTEDKEGAVAFAAAHSLWRRGESTPSLLALARQELAVHPDNSEATAVLAELGEPADAPLLSATLQDPVAERRLSAVKGMLRLKAGTPGQIEFWLADPSTAVVQTALSGLNREMLEPHRTTICRLANHPYNPVAEAARLILTPLAPTDPRQRALFELTVEHPYVRRQIVAALAADGSPEALDDLESATENTEPHIRASALLLLSERDPARARKPLARLLTDTHRTVRLYAAAVAARIADAELIDVIKETGAKTQDPAILLYLADAAAIAEGKPLPAPPPSVNRVSADTNLSFNCGWSGEVDRSPFQGFYGMHLPKTGEEEAMRKAHAAGKIFLLRANETVKNPAQVLLNPAWQDGFWLGLDKEFGPFWDTIDGLVIGEETMYFRPWNVWADGWRLFCRETGIDPVRILGDRERLTETEKQAWWDWEQRVAVEGFNTVYEYIKLRYGKIRPGFQVATFMPGQNGPCAYDREWKFDIGADYDYATNSRTRYARIRRQRTVWPDRPVLWLNQGKVGMGLGLNLTAIQHSTAVPTSPVHNLTGITAADSLTTWLAGGHTGSFSIYLFVHVGWKGEDFGRWVGLDDITPTSPVLKEALNHSFRGLGEKYKIDDEIKNAKPTTDKEENDVLTLEDPAEQEDPYALREAREREAFRLGILLERKLIQDCLNQFSGLPFPPHARTVLLVGPGNMRAPAFDLVNDFDCFFQINKLAGQDLSGYRLIGLSQQASTPLMDSTITAVSSWLKAQAGVLYVHGWVSTESTSELGTVTDRDGTLSEHWPWAKDLRPVTKEEKVKKKDVTVTEGYQVSGGACTVLREADGRATLVYWQGDGFKGGVLFDSGSTDREELRGVLNRLHAEKGVGLALTGPTGMNGAVTKTFSAFSSGGAGAATHEMKGVDLLSGIRNPALTEARSGAFTASELQGTFAAARNGIAILCSEAFTALAPAPGGLTVTCTGVIQAVSESGRIEVSTSQGDLPAIEPKQLLAWLLDNTNPGIARVTRANPDGELVFVRGSGEIKLTVKNDN